MWLDSDGGSPGPCDSRAGVGGNARRPVTAVPVKAANGTTFDWGPGVPLFNAVPFFRSTARGYDISLEDWKFVKEDTFASKGQHLIYHGPLKRFEKQLLQSPIAG